MKKAVTFRFDAALLEEARQCAARDNRTLTNFIETLVKTHVAKTSQCWCCAGYVRLADPDPSLIIESWKLP